MLKQDLRFYELIVIFRSKVLQKEAEELVKKEVQVLKGKLVKVVHWGEKEMVYKIDKEDKGLYALFEIELPKEDVAKLLKSLNMQKDILRTMISLRSNDKTAVGSSSKRQE